MKLAIDKIEVNGRHRRDMGDVGSLANSIATIGLLHPVVITAGHHLIAGERRIAAARSLNWTEIEVRFVDSLDDAKFLLLAERDENTCRKDFTPSEAVAVGRQLEELERPRAEQRRRDTQGRPKKTAENFTAVSAEPKTTTRDVVGQAVGMSGVTYQRAKAVVTASESEPKKFAPIVAEMDRTGKVNTAYKQVIEDRDEAKSKIKSDSTTALPKRLGRGIALAHKAIEVLKNIPSNDALREDGLRTVARWIKDNK